MPIVKLTSTPFQGPSTSHSAPFTGTLPNNRTSGRAAKRLLDYNEDSDATTEENVPRRHLAGEQRVVNSDPDDDDDEDEDERENGEPTVSVSSRGRVRKIVAKARRIFRE